MRLAFLLLLLCPWPGLAAEPGKREKTVKAEPSTIYRLLERFRDDISRQMGELDPLVRELEELRDACLERGELPASGKARERLRGDIISRMETYQDSIHNFGMARKQEDLKKILSAMASAVGVRGADQSLGSGIAQYHVWSSFDKEARSFGDRVHRVLRAEDESYQALKQARRMRRFWMGAVGGLSVLLLGLGTLWLLRREPPVHGLQAGAVMKGAYRVLNCRPEPAGSAWAETGEALDLGLERRVVIKRLRGELTADRRSLERFLEAARRAAALKHPHIVKTYSVFEQERQAYLVFEAVKGAPLSRRLEVSGSLNPSTAKSLLRQAAAALDHAHAQGVLHRGLRPSCLLLGPEDSVKIADFGTLAAFPYRAPEQTEPDAVLRESDLYALGAIAFEMLAGRLPSRRPSGLPPALEHVFQKALDCDPRRRYHSASAFMEALEGALA
ncbi:MAG TPA: hypothetical protein DCM05_13800 [Elusimicrobia bacterium]|nr:hypothetical protein [Elusimicrobiota bacterium]